MAKVGSLTTFVPKSTVVSADVNKNFADLKAGINEIDDEQIANGAAIAGSKLDTGLGRLVQTTDLKASSDELTLTTAYQDLAGASATFTPDVACRALVVATFDLRGIDSVTSGGLLTGILNVDNGAQAQSRVAQIAVDSPEGAKGILVRATVAQVYRVPLTAASHTLKLQARKEPESGGSLQAYCAQATLSYQLVAQ